MQIYIWKQRQAETERRGGQREKEKQRLILRIIHNETTSEAGMYGIYKYFKI